MIFKITRVIKNFLNSKRKVNSILNELKKINKNKDSILLIGNSKYALSEKKGSIIDKFNYVIRFNAAKTSGYVEFVGKKINMAVINQKIFERKYVNTKIDKNYVNKLNKKDIFVILEDNVDQNYNYTNLKKKNNLIFFHNKLNHYLRYCLVSKYNYIKKFYYYFFGKKLSAGMILIYLLIRCRYKIYIYGFDFKKTKKNYSHYYDINYSNLDTKHDWKWENNLLNSLIKKEKLHTI